MNAGRHPADAATLLVVEDDPDLRSSLVAWLSTRYRVEEAADAAGAMRRWEARRPDLVLLDLGLPDLDGMAVIRRIRRDATTPILVLSARDREPDKVAALDQGADDYVTKPFGVAELDARVGALLRRSAGPTAGASGELVVGPLRIDVPRHEVSVGDVPVRLTPRDFEVLRVLAVHAGRLVTHGRLLRAVCGAAYTDEAHYLHVYVSSIRRKLTAADPTGSVASIIVSEPGVGYRVSVPAGDEAPRSAASRGILSDP